MIINRFTFPSIINTDRYLDNPEQGPLHYHLCGFMAYDKGNAKVGHYISFIKIGKKWYEIDDSKVTDATQQEAMDRHFGSNSQLGNKARPNKCCFPILMNNKPVILYFFKRDNKTIF